MDCLLTEYKAVPAVDGKNVLRIPAKNFDPARYECCQKISLDLEFGLATGVSAFPVLLVRGAKEGKTLVVSAGIHGDEFEGVQAILQVVAELDPSVMHGTVIAVPIANLSAFYKGTRTSPLDGLNLARCFPGKQHGSPTEVLAFHLAESIIARADLYLDLHSAGVKLLMPTMVGYDPRDPRSRDAAAIFGTPVVWAHSSIEPGRTISFAASRNIPWLYTEAHGAGRVHPQDLAVFKRGIFNLLVHLGIQPGQVVAHTIDHVLHGDGNIDAAIPATRSGFLIRAVELLEEINVAQKLGHSVDLHGRLIETFRSPCSGVVGMIRAFPVIESGDPLFLIAGSKKSLS